MDTPDRPADKTQQITEGPMHLVALLLLLLPPHRSTEAASGAEREENFLSGLCSISFNPVPPPPDTVVEQPSVRCPLQLHQHELWRTFSLITLTSGFTLAYKCAHFPSSVAFVFADERSLLVPSLMTPDARVFQLLLNEKSPPPSTRAFGIALQRSCCLET